MNIQEASFRNTLANDTSERLLLDRSSAFLKRTATATVAAAEAADVDLNARFPKAAIDAAREQKLLGMQIPVEFGGFGASMSDVTDACSSAAMIFAMHQTKIACLVRHGTGSRFHEKLMRRVASEQLLLASSTTEGQNGGNIRFSSAAVEHAGAAGSLADKELRPLDGGSGNAGQTDDQQRCATGVIVCAWIFS